MQILEFKQKEERKKGERKREKERKKERKKEEKKERKKEKGIHCMCYTSNTLYFYHHTIYCVLCFD